MEEPLLTTPDSPSYAVTLGIGGYGPLMLLGLIVLAQDYFVQLVHNTGWDGHLQIRSPIMAGVVLVVAGIAATIGFLRGQTWACPVALVGLAVPAFVVLGHVLDLADHVKEMAQSEMPLDTDPTTLVSAFPVLTASLVIFGIMTVLYAVLLCSARVQDVRRSRHHSRSVEAD